MYSHIVSYYVHKAKTDWQFALTHLGMPTPHGTIAFAYQAVSRSGIHHLRRLDWVCDFYHKRRVI